MGYETPLLVGARVKVSRVMTLRFVVPEQHRTSLGDNDHDASDTMLVSRDRLMRTPPAKGL